MADEWKVGDLALCVELGKLPGLRGRGICVLRPGDLEAGKTYSVLAVGICDFDGGVILDVGGPVPFDERRFRKIRPDEHEDCEPEFVELLNRIKRKVEA